MSIPINEQTLKTAFEYLEAKAAQALANEQELAKRMGIDPDKDLVLIPMDLLQQWNFYKIQRRMPRWAMLSGRGDIKVIKGVRGGR